MNTSLIALLDSIGIWILALFVAWVVVAYTVDLFKLMLTRNKQ